MGIRSFVFGYIEEAWPGARSNGSPGHAQLLANNARAIERHNEEILSSLPTQDGWPPLVKQMFAWSPADAPMINYKTRPIHFAASLKEVDWDLRDWMDKFESLLRRLYWEKAVVHFHAAYLGEHRFTWRPSQQWVDKLTNGVLEPITQWEFEGSMDVNELHRLRSSAT
jgi:hypothetical protein